MAPESSTDAPDTPSATKSHTLTKERLETLKALYCAGESAVSLSKTFGIKPATIRQYAHRGDWASPQRVKRHTKSNHLPNVVTDSPAAAVANLWLERQASHREDIYSKAKKALDRFFAMQPTPQSFQEAKIANDLLNSALNNGESKGAAQPNINLAILTNGFQPTPMRDVSP